jgi:phosphomethylpyrimidine synthase
MIAPAEAFEPSSTDPLPNSSRVYVEGSLHKDVRVPMREISLSPTKRFDGSLEKNEPVRVYDAAGPWGDENFDGDVTQGLPALRAEWIKARADVSEYDGREVKPQDNGYLSRNHAEYASKAERNRLLEFPGLRPPRHPALVCPPRHRHARDGIHRHPRKHGPRKNRRTQWRHPPQRS